MKRRTTTLFAVCVALCGFTLAVFIPAASAFKAHNTYTEDCQNGTNTTYSEYSEYCPAPTSTGTSPVVTSPGTTPVTTPVASPSTTSVTTPTVTTGPGDTGSPASVSIPGAVIGPDGVIRFASVGSSLPVGTILAPGVTVTENTDGSITIDDNGTVVNVPYGSQLSVAPNGVIIITPTQANAAAFTDARFPHAGTTTDVQYVICPPHRTSRQVYYVLARGVSFGKRSTWAKVSSSVKIYRVTDSKSLRVARTPVKAAVQLQKAAANKGRWAFTIKAAKPMSVYAVKFNTTVLKYTTAAAKARSLTTRFAVSSALGGTVAKDHTTFTYTP